MEKFKTFDLPYGGKLYYVKNKLTKATMVDLQFLCGARVDTIPGLAHFTEHMFFTGTKDKDKKQISKQYFDFIGSNAFTNGKEIRFIGNVFTNEFGAYLDTVAELITKSTFSQANVNKEIPVVLQEIAGAKDKYGQWATEFNGYNLFKQAYLKNRVLGNEASVSSIKSKDVKQYVNQYFVANNLRAYVASPMCVKKIKKLVEKFANSIPNRPDFKPLPMRCVNVENDSFYKIKTVDIGKSYLFLNFKFNHTCFERDFKVKCGVVLGMINDFTEGLQKRMRLEKSLVYGCDVSAGYFEKNSVATMYTECEKGNINKILQVGADYFKDKLKNGFTQAELDKYLRNWKYDNAVKEPRASKYMTNLNTLALYGSVKKKKDIDKIIKKMTVKDCNLVFKEMFACHKISLSTYGDALTADVMTKSEFDKLFDF